MCVHRYHRELLGGLPLQRTGTRHFYRFWRRLAHSTNSWSLIVHRTVSCRATDMKYRIVSYTAECEDKLCINTFHGSISTALSPVVLKWRAIWAGTPPPPPRHAPQKNHLSYTGCISMAPLLMPVCTIRIYDYQHSDYPTSDRSIFSVISDFIKLRF